MTFLVSFFWPISLMKTGIYVKKAERVLRFLLANCF